jgi:hypothetical protein
VSTRVWTLKDSIETAVGHASRTNSGMGFFFQSKCSLDFMTSSKEKDDKQKNRGHRFQVPAVGIERELSLGQHSNASQAAGTHTSPHGR